MCTLQELYQALRHVITADITQHDIIQLCSLVDVQPISGIDGRLFVGLAALAERLYRAVDKTER